MAPIPHPTCSECTYYSANVMLPDGGGKGKCWKIMDVTVTHSGSYGIVDAKFYCGQFSVTTPTKNDIQNHIHFLAERMDEVADLMRAYEPTSLSMLTHAGELSGAADLCREWVNSMEDNE